MLSYTDRHPEDPNLMGYAEFELRGHSFQSWQPANDKARRELVIEVRKDGELILTEKVQMYHENRFGVDIEDNAALEDKTEEIIRELGLQ